MAFSHLCKHRLLGIVGMLLLISAASIQSAEEAELAPIYPRALKPGDTIMFVAPARPLERERTMQAVHALESAGFRVKLPADLFRGDGYLAGSDQVRADEIMRAFADPEVDAIFPGTGGYGTTRFLQLLNYETIRQNPKIFIGFSDITGLHLAIHQRTGLITFHSPNPDSGLGTDRFTAFSKHWFFRAITPAPEDPNGYQITATGAFSGSDDSQQNRFQQSCDMELPHAITGGKATGRLVGGNLSLIAALMGTPFEIQTKDRILFIEDIGEAPYRVDRMLSTLKLAGKLDEVAGAVLGTFTRRADENTKNDKTSMADVLEDYFKPLGIPVLGNFPIGHHPCNATLPIGVDCELDADGSTIRLLRSPVTRGD